LVIFASKKEEDYLKTFDGGERPIIDYPCKWEFKVIGQELESILKTIDDLLADKFEYDLTPSNISQKGKYYSLNLKVLVNTEEERNMIYQHLLNNGNIKMVL